MKVISSAVQESGETQYTLTGGYTAYSNGDIFTPKRKLVKPESARYGRFQVAIKVYEKIQAHKEKA